MTPVGSSDSDSEGEPFIIPQFDGANDFVIHRDRGRRQQQTTSGPPQHHRPVTASTRDFVRENALKRSRGGASHPASAPRFPHPPSVPSSQHQPVPSSFGLSQHSSLVNPDGTLPDFMDISSLMAAGEVQAPSIVPHTPARGKSSRRDFPPPQDMQQPPPPLNITPLSGMGMSQRLPGIGDAMVVPALVTSGRVSLTSPQMMMPQSYVLQHHSPATDLDSCPDTPQPSGQDHKQSGRAAAGESQQAGSSLRTLSRQDSEHSAYSPISDESDGEGSGRGRRGHGTGEARAPDAPDTPAAPENGDILKQAFDMTLFDLKPMDVETPEFVLMSPGYPEPGDGCPAPTDDMLAPDPYLHQAEDYTTVTTTNTQGDGTHLEAPYAPPTPSPPPPQPQPRREPPPPTSKTKKKKQKPGRERSSIM